ncbi:MAG TPA: kelch repeat-containing protein, partial [Steroidobacteraceae bacterium]|nr:kelch repeat-containing protein [Steroidobacteraceae bacterium]
MSGRARLYAVAAFVAGFAACSGGGDGGELDGKQTTYAIGGNVTGLNLVTGQPVPSLTITNQSPIVSELKSVTVSGNVSFAFPAVPTGTDYRLIIASPSGYTCVFANSNGNGQVVTATVTNLNVACTAGQHSIGGQVTGLGSGNPGLQLANGSNLLQISGDGPFTFTQTALGGATYSVAISVAHPQFECAVIGGTGSVGNANVNDVGLSCATTVRANVSGLGAGSSIQLINDYTLPGATTAVADTQLTVTGPSAGTFATRLPSGAQYAVRVSQGNPSVQCSVGNPTGTIGASIVNVSVTCTPIFVVGGIVRGLAPGRTLILRNNGTDNVTISANGAFAFSTSLAAGSMYRVTVATQPSGEACFPAGGYATEQAGAVTAQVTDILVSCGMSNSWTWIGGSNTGNGAATFGTKGQPSRSNIPRATTGAVTWTDSSRNFWMFGGQSSGDLWKYSPSTWAWTWVSGPGTSNPFGVYGPKGAASTLHQPGSRSSAVSWLGADGKLWMFGGYGFDQANQSGSLNDLWVFDPADATWTWVSGAGAIGSAGVYGTQGAASTTNTPGARTDAIAWTDLQGNFWLLGGQGISANGQSGYL